MHPRFSGWFTRQLISVLRGTFYARCTRAVIDLVPKATIHIRRWCVLWHAPDIQGSLTGSSLAARKVTSCGCLNILRTRESLRYPVLIAALSRP